MTREQQLEHRLAMIFDDLHEVRVFLEDNGLMDAFKKRTRYADSCLTHINNIEIACDLSSDESLSWNSFGRLTDEV